MTWLKLGKIQEILFLTGTTFSKLAILALYKRVFTTRPYILATFTIGTLVVFTFIGGILASAFICRPFSYHWNRTIHGGHCGDIVAGYRWVGLPNIITDFFILLLPIPEIYQLHTDRFIKAGIFLTFFTGSL